MTLKTYKIILNIFLVISVAAGGVLDIMMPGLKLPSIRPVI